MSINKWIEKNRINKILISIYKSLFILLLFEGDNYLSASNEVLALTLIFFLFCVINKQENVFITMLFFVINFVVFRFACFGTFIYPIKEQPYYCVFGDLHKIMAAILFAILVLNMVVFFKKNKFHWNGLSILKLAIFILNILVFIKIHLSGQFLWAYVTKHNLNMYDVPIFYSVRIIYHFVQTMFLVYIPSLIISGSFCVKRNLQKQNTQIIVYSA